MEKITKKFEKITLKLQESFKKSVVYHDLGNSVFAFVKNYCSIFAFVKYY